MSNSASQMTSKGTPDPGPLRLPVQSLVSALAGRSTLDEPAFTYIDYSSDRAGARRTLTWSELYLRVTAVAARIRELADTSGRVAILCPQDLSYPVAFFGALASGAIAVPLFAPEVSSHADRLTGALADCEATVWLTAESTLGGVEKLLDDPHVPPPAGVIAVDGIDLDAAEGFQLPEIDLGATAYLQYTSGSTRAPAGAVITHEAVAANVRQLAAAFDLGEHSTFVGWIPFFHDMGLVSLACLPAGLGGQSVFSTPFAFIRRPLGWLEMMAGHPNVMTAAPNFAFDYAVDRVRAEDRAGLDLSGVHVAINGSEPVRPHTVERFQETFGPCGLAPHAHRPSYGLAEATVFVTATGRTGPTTSRFVRSELMEGRAVAARADADADAVALVSAGKPVGQHVCIVDPVGRTARPDGEVGEVWVHGPNLATSYWGQPERSEEVFNGCLAGGADGLPVAGWLRTGDLGVSHGGELYITGRLKDLIIVDGKNHYPQDIEQTVQEAHPAIQPGRVAAFGIPTEADEGIVVVMERARGAAADEVRASDIAVAVRRAVAAAHDLKLRDVHVLNGEKVLRTSSGKIARTANRDRYLAEHPA
jgi:fatty acid CoA ligase FadD32